MQNITNSNNFQNQNRKYIAQLPGPSESIIHPVYNAKKLKPSVVETSSQPLTHRLASLPETNSKPIVTISDNASSNAFSNAALRSKIGGKGLFLTLMQEMPESKLPVPAFQCVETGIMESIERQSLPRKLLETHFPELAPFSGDTFSLEEMKQSLIGMPGESRLRSLEQLSGFIASDAFYRHVVAQNREAVVKIRDAQRALIPGKPVIVRSSGVAEDNYSDAQAGKYDSIVHGEQDIVQTYLKVMASGYHPKACPEGVPHAMAIIIQQCIDCHLGGVIMSYLSLQDDTLRVEYGPGQPRLVVSGESGITPHRYDLSQNQKKYTPGHINSTYRLETCAHDGLGYKETVRESVPCEDGGQTLSDSQLDRLYQYTIQLENRLFCPVDVEFGIDAQGDLFLFQVRPITRLSGGTQFAIATPENPLIRGELISEGICSGSVFVVHGDKETVEPGNIQDGAIIFAPHGDDWMLAPELLNRVGGFVFKDCGTNDHVAITLRQAGKPCLQAIYQRENSFLPSDGQPLTLVCGHFNKMPQALVLNGNQMDELQKNMIVTADIDDMATPYPRVRNPSSEYDLNRPDTGFQWLNNQNTLLLDYFHPDRLLHRCLSPENCLKLSMSANRNQLIANLQGEINDFIEDTRRLLEGCQQFLQLGLNNPQCPDGLSITQFRHSYSWLFEHLGEIEKLTTRFRQIEQNIKEKTSAITTPFTSGNEQVYPSVNFRHWREDCRALKNSLQTLNSPTDAESINSLHDFIFWLHRRFIEAIRHVAVCSQTGTITNNRKLTVIDFVKTVEPCQSLQAIKDLLKQSKLPTYIVNMSKAMIVNTELGVHVCVVEMLEQAESGKGRTLRLSLSDDFEGSFFQGKLNRCLYISLLLKTIFNNAELNANITFNKNTQTLVFESTHIDTPEKMQDVFLKIFPIMLRSPNFDVHSRHMIFDNRLLRWDLDFLNEKIKKGFSSEENILMFKHLLFLQGARFQIPSFKPKDVGDPYQFFFTFGIESGKLPQRNFQFTKNFTKRTKAGSVNPKDRILEEFFNENQKKLRVYLKKIPSHLRDEILYHFFLYNPEGAIPLFEKRHYAWLQNREMVLQSVCINGLLLAHVDDHFKNEKEIVLPAVSSNPLAIYSACNRFLSDPDIMRAAVTEKTGHLLALAGDNLKSSEEFLLSLSNLKSALEQAKPFLKVKRDFVRKLVKKYDGDLLDDIDESLKNDKEIFKIAVKYHPRVLKNASKVLQTDPDILLAACTGNYTSGTYKSKVYKLVTKIFQKHYKSDNSLAQKIIHQDGLMFLAVLCKEFQNIKSIVLAGVKQYGMALQFASKTLQSDREVVLAAVKQNGMALQFASKELQNDREIVLAAVKQNGMAIQFASKELQNDSEVALAAVRNNGNALEFVSTERQNDREIIMGFLASKKPYCEASVKHIGEPLRDDKEIALILVEKFSGALKLLSETLRNNNDVAQAAVKYFPTAIQYVGKKFLDNWNFVLPVVRNNVNVLNILGENFKNNLFFMIAAIKDNAEAYKFASERLKHDSWFLREALRINPDVYKYAL